MWSIGKRKVNFTFYLGPHYGIYRYIVTLHSLGNLIQFIYKGLKFDNHIRYVLF